MFAAVVSFMMLMSFEIGPTMGAIVPVQDEGDPWKPGFVIGLKTRYCFSEIDLDFQLRFTELGIDPDSSRGYNYSMIPITIGLSKNFGFMRFGAGTGLYPIEAKKEIVEGLESVWNGTFAGMYVSLGKDFAVGSNTFDLSSKFNIIDFNSLWIGLTASYLF